MTRPVPTAYITLLDALGRAMRVVVDPALADARHRRQFADAMINDLMALPGPRSLDRKLTRDEAYLGKLFKQFAEISKSLEMLDEIVLYARRAPQLKGASKARHLRFHVESFYNEVYVLRERLLAFIAFVMRAFRKTSVAAETHRIGLVLPGAVKEAFSGIVTARGRHVHERRFAERELNRMEDLEFISRIGPDDWLRTYSRVEARKIRRRWVQALEQVVAAAWQVVEFCFGRLASILCNSTGDLRFPVARGA